LVPRLANELAGMPPKRLAFRLATCVVDLTTNGAVPVATFDYS
jgi:hypothetical protein